MAHPIRRLCGIAVFALVLPFAAQAEKYHWVDDAGQDHFADVPPEGVPYETVTEAQEKVIEEQNLGRDQLHEYAEKQEKDRASALKKQDEERKARASSNQRCAVARAELANLQSKPARLWTNADGSRMTEEEYAAESQRQQKVVDSYCK